MAITAAAALPAPPSADSAWASYKRFQAGVPDTSSDLQALGGTSINWSDSNPAGTTYTSALSVLGSSSKGKDGAPLKP